MGMDIEGRLMVGYDAIEIDDSVVDEETFYEFVEKHDLDISRPYFDPIWQDCFVGIEIRNFDSGDIQALVESAESELRSKVGGGGELRAVADVC